MLSLLFMTIKAMDQKQVTARLLDLSTAFDTIDHSTLLHRCSSSIDGITGTAVFWIESYLIFRPFKVTVNNNFFFPIPCSSWCSSWSWFSVRSSTVNLCTIPLISASSASHRLYADGTQLFIAFDTSNFESNICCQQLP